MTRAATVLGLLLILGICGCRQQYRMFESAQLGAWQKAHPADQAHDADSNTAFGLKLLQELMRERPGENVTISPLGLGLALGMLYDGAGTATRDEIADALAVRGLEPEAVGRQYRALATEALHADRKVQLRLATALWADEGKAFTTGYLPSVRRHYLAEAFNISFTDPGAAASMNDWVSQQTKARVGEVVAPGTMPPGSMAMMLADAVAFSGRWTTKFREHMTQPKPFTAPGRRTRTVQMMEQSGQYACLATRQFEAVSLPYASGRLSMYVFVPTAESDLNTLCRSLTAQTWGVWMGGFAERPGKVELPRFETAGGLALDETLKALGMREAFVAGRADFGPMCGGGVWVGTVRHGTYIRVAEKGTEALAAAQMPMMMKSSTPILMAADHPFLWAIRDNKTGALVFLGVIVDPGDAPRIGR
jgi:serpin B